MNDEQIKQKAEEYANSMKYTNGEPEWVADRDAFIAGAHSRDKEIKELKEENLRMETLPGMYRRMTGEYELKLQELRNPWISVNDRLPDDNQVVLAHHEIIIDGGGEHEEDENVTIQRYEGKWITDRMEQQRMGKWLFDITDRVTHWMPIPKLPKEK